MTKAQKPLPLAQAGDHSRDRAVMAAVLDYWSAQDVEQTVALMADDIVYQLYVCNSAHPFGGEWIGRDAVRTLLFDLLAAFDYLAYDPVILDVQDGVARIQSSYRLRHRATGEDLSGSKRLVCTLHGGLVTRIHEYEDAPKFQAFLRLTDWRLALQGGTATTFEFK